MNSKTAPLPLYMHTEMLNFMSSMLAPILKEDWTLSREGLPFLKPDLQKELLELQKSAANQNLTAIYPEIAKEAQKRAEDFFKGVSLYHSHTISRGVDSKQVV